MNTPTAQPRDVKRFGPMDIRRLNLCDEDRADALDNTTDFVIPIERAKTLMRHAPGSPEYARIVDETAERIADEVLRG